MDDVLRDLSTPALVAALEANLAEQYAYYRGAPGARTHDDPEVTWYISGIPIPEYNGVAHMRLAPDLPPAQVEAHVAATLRPFRAGRVPLTWWIGPSTRPANLATYLEARGLVHVVDLPGMAANLRALSAEAGVPEGVTIEHVGDLAALEDWVRVAGAGYGEPESIQRARLEVHASLGLGERLPLRRYLARRRGEPVAIAALFLGAGVAGIYEVATLPSARRQGIGAATVCAPLREALALGYQAGVLASSPMVRSLYQRLGFQEYTTFHLYMRETWDAQAQSSMGL